MIATDIYRPDQWHDFFIMVGGGAAALTGLVFVALSLNLHAMLRDATHRSRAIGTLTSFAAVFITCALALMGGQNHVAVGLEWLLVSGAASYIYVDGYVRARQQGQSALGLNWLRLGGGTGCYVAQVVGSLMLMLGDAAGLYIAATAMIIFFAFMISGAWLLLVGVHLEQKTDSGLS